MEQDREVEDAADLRQAEDIQAKRVNQGTTHRNGTKCCSVPNRLFRDKALKHGGFRADLERDNNFFLIEQINGVFERNQVRETHVYTRVRVFLCCCSRAEDI